MHEAMNRRAKALSVALRERDARTSAHSSRVGGLALELGKQRGLSEPELDLLRLSAEFHDVGKIGVPDSVLLKPGTLTEDERAIAETHAEIGQRIILETDMPNAETVALAVRHHHERYDGGGYPDGLVGDDIPLLSRIIAVADTYDTMASDRVYSKAMSHTQIMALLCLERGHQHDASLFADFARVIERSEYRAGEY